MSILVPYINNINDNIHNLYFYKRNKVKNNIIIYDNEF